MASNELWGDWLSRYTYHDGAAESQHVVHFTGIGGLRGLSREQEDGSELQMYLNLDESGIALTGLWWETTSPKGQYGGRKFQGAVQLLLAADKQSAAGKWVGYNSDMTEVNHGVWELKRQPEEVS
jgi:hypothetical protein